VCHNLDKSAVSFCQQVAAWVQDIFSNSYLVKNHKSAYKSSTTEAREKISTYLELLEYQNKFDVFLTLFN
jgi:hypothetical protein